MDTLKVSEGFLVTQEADRLGPLGLWLFVHSHAARIVLHRYVVEQAAATSAPHEEEVAFSDLYRTDGPFERAWAEVESQFERRRPPGTLGREE